MALRVDPPPHFRKFDITPHHTTPANSTTRYSSGFELPIRRQATTNSLARSECFGLSLIGKGIRAEVWLLGGVFV